jgi:prephenate dehydrogenase
MRRFECVAIIGVGLIGGSVGLALRQRNLAQKVVGIGRRHSSLRIARRVGAVTTTTVDIARGVADAELVVVCTPVGQIVEHVREAAAHCPEGTLITDAGSTKKQIVDQLDGSLPRGCRFLGSHPLAGSEKSGPAHAAADLFEGRVAIITPTANTRAEDFDLIEQFWEALGSVVISLSAEEHDRALALTSHLPHVVAAALALSVPEKLFRLCGAGLLDTTRLAAGDPLLWQQILLYNRDFMLSALEQLGEKLHSFREAIRHCDAEKLLHLLAQAKRTRDALGS